METALGDDDIAKSALADVTVRLTAAVCVMPPPDAVIVTVDVPVAVADPTEIVMLDEPAPGAAIDDGLKLAVAPEGSPEAERLTTELKTPVTEVDIVELPEPPCTTDRDVGDAETEKSVAVTVSPTVVV
jgi:hypothetical protein